MMFRLRFGYLFMVVGLAIVKWPLLPRAHELPPYEGVTLCLLTAMSLLALAGLRYPLQLIPILLFEVLWKLIWLSLVALPQALNGPLDPLTREITINCAFVVVIIATVPWRTLSRFIRQSPHAPTPHPDPTIPSATTRLPKDTSRGDGLGARADS
jgi:hypothetical protein